MIRLAILVISSGVATHSFADHWNTKNLLDACDDDNAFAEDKRLCLETRPKSELYDCLGEYGWFDKPAVIQLGD